MIYKPKTTIMNYLTLLTIVIVLASISLIIAGYIFVRNLRQKRRLMLDVQTKLNAETVSKTPRKPHYSKEDIIHIRNEWINLLHNAINDNFYLVDKKEIDEETTNCRLCEYAKSFRQNKYGDSSHSDLVNLFGCERCILKCTLPNTTNIISCFQYPSMRYGDNPEHRIIKSAKHALHILKHITPDKFDPGYIFQSDTPVPILYIDSVNYRRRKKLTYPDKLGIPLLKTNKFGG